VLDLLPVFYILDHQVVVFIMCDLPGEKLFFIFLDPNTLFLKALEGSVAEL